MIEMKFRTKKEKVYHLLREDIVSGRLKPETKLVTSTIAKRFGVSEIPAREALQALVQDGFVEVVPHTGYVVSGMSEDDVREIFELRVQMEGMAARQAVQRLSNLDIAELTEMVEDAKVLVEQGDLHGYWLANREFHDALYKHCGNRRLYSIICDLYSYSRRFPPYYTRVEELAESITEHLELIGLLRERDEDKVEQWMRQHTMKGYAHVLERLKTWETEKEE